MTIGQLNTDFGVDGQLEFVVGSSGLPFIKIVNESATAVISLHGGQILSFKPEGAVADLLFLSDRSSYGDGKAIRGGIPVCWPWFGPDPKGLNRPNHGFVRNHLWRVLRTESTPTETKISLQFQESDKKEKTWKQPFILTLEFTIGKSLGLKLISHNPGDRPFSFTQAFHTYFRVGDITQVEVMGFDGCQYYDKLAQGEEKSQQGNITIDRETDRIYMAVTKPLVVNDPSLNRQIHILSRNCSTGVVWNPWQTSDIRLNDLGPEDYRHFVCVETGNIAFDLITLQPGDNHSLSSTFTIVEI